MVCVSNFYSTLSKHYHPRNNFDKRCQRKNITRTQKRNVRKTDDIKILKIEKSIQQKRPKK